MGYRVEYGPAPEKVPSFFVKNRVWMMTAIFLMLFALAVKLFWPEGTAALCQVFLPGESGTMQSAISGLIDHLQSGQTFSEAMTVFCKEIITDAGVILQ